MTLPASQQRALDAIDDVLQSAEPRLATMFGVFTDLTRLDAMPAAETLEPGPWWARHRLAGPLYRPGWSGHLRPWAGQRRHQPGQTSPAGWPPAQPGRAGPAAAARGREPGRRQPGQQRAGRAARLQSGRGGGHGGPAARRRQRQRGVRERRGYRVPVKRAAGLRGQVAPPAGSRHGRLAGSWRVPGQGDGRVAGRAPQLPRPGTHERSAAGQRRAPRPCRPRRPPVSPAAPSGGSAT